MKIIVTGPNGFVGKHIMRALPQAEGVPSLRGGREDVIRRVADADVIIHTAAVSSIPACEQDPEGSYRANVLLPVWIAEAAPHARLLFFSSDQVYTGCQSEGPYREEDAMPANTYARQKLEMEQRVLDIAPDAVLLRATWMFDDEWGYIKSLLSAGETVMQARAHRAVTYVREVAEQIAQMAVMPVLPGGAYNFGSENPLTMAELTRETLKLLGIDKPVTEQGEAHPLWMDGTKPAAAGIRFGSSLEGVERCIREYGLKR